MVDIAAAPILITTDLTNISGSIHYLVYQAFCRRIILMGIADYLEFISFEQYLNGPVISRL